MEKKPDKKSKSILGFSREELSYIARAFGYLKPYKTIAIIIGFLTIAASLVELVPMYLQKLIIDQAIYYKNVKMLITLSVATILFPVIQAIMEAVSGYLNTWISLRMSQNARQNLVDHVQKLDFTFYTKHSSGDLMARGITDAETISSFGVGIPVRILNNLVILITAFVICVRYEWWLALLNIFLYFLEYFPTKAGGIEIAKRSKDLRDLDSMATRSLHESLNGIKILQIFRREKEHHEEYRSNTAKYASQAIKLSVFRGKVGIKNEYFRALGSIISWGVIGLYVYSGKYTVGEMWMLTYYLRMMSAPFRMITYFVYLRVKEQVPYLSRFFEYLDTEPDIKEMTNAIEAKKFIGDIYFDSVSFSYKSDINNPTHIFDNLTFSIKAGSTAALVGASGAGKSTIAKLIPRFYNIDSGTISIDGIDVREYTLKSLRRRIGTVFQDTYLFNATIRDNLLIAQEGASDAELIEATKVAQIYDFIEELPEGLNTLVGERGIKLSGGQRQRMAIARLLLYAPDILIFDEATASLDSETETAVTRALYERLKGKTRIIIAHRLSTVINADCIFVVDDGKIVEQGSHKELLAQHGAYERLYKVMFSSEQEGVEAV